ncbi:hypothetical protein [Streptomyces shenzhenensis]|uniref:hypothetical protein n=1 Tax=Streptomyces shenzhenensis TaxID=943815 RepID=UPI00217D0D7F|nr:hypothetical protein [Streptomyces shenzhenensis]
MKAHIVRRPALPERLASGRELADQFGERWVMGNSPRFLELGAAAMLSQVLATIQAVHVGEHRRRAVLAYTTALGAPRASLGQVIGGGLLALDD